jgi:hypothetical protein
MAGFNLEPRLDTKRFAANLSRSVKRNFPAPTRDQI